MTPAASSRRTRSSDARGDSPTVCASFWIVERPSRCSAARILTSSRSNADGRLAAMNVLILVERLVLDRHRIVQREPAAVGIDGLAGDIARVRRSEEEGDRRDLV